MRDLVLTVDVDWAPVHVIQPLVEHLVDQRVKATWFITDDSDSLALLREHQDLFELGIHPNFLPGSSHGSDPEEILDHVLQLVPDAVSVRTHASVYSGRIIELLFSRPRIRFDVTTLLPGMRNVEPVEHWLAGRRLWRIPYIWADDHTMEMPEPRWTLDPVLALEGLKVVSVHPVHVYINTRSAQDYKAFKDAHPDIARATPQTTSGFVNSGMGARTFFAETVDFLARRGGSKQLRELAS